MTTLVIAAAVASLLAMLVLALGEKVLGTLLNK